MPAVVPGRERRGGVRGVAGDRDVDRVAVLAALALEAVLELVARFAADARPLDRRLVAGDRRGVRRRERRRDAEQLDARLRGARALRVVRDTGEDRVVTARELGAVDARRHRVRARVAAAVDDGAVRAAGAVDADLVRAALVGVPRDGGARVRADRGRVGRLDRHRRRQRLADGELEWGRVVALAAARTDRGDAPAVGAVAEVGVERRARDRRRRRVGEVAGVALADCLDVVALRAGRRVPGQRRRRIYRRAVRGRLQRRDGRRRRELALRHVDADGAREGAVLDVDGERLHGVRAVGRERVAPVEPGRRAAVVAEVVDALVVEHRDLGSFAVDDLDAAVVVEGQVVVGLEEHPAADRVACRCGEVLGCQCRIRTAAVDDGKVTPGRRREGLRRRNVLVPDTLIARRDERGAVGRVVADVVGMPTDCPAGQVAGLEARVRDRAQRGCLPQRLPGLEMPRPGDRPLRARLRRCDRRSRQHRGRRRRRARARRLRRGRPARARSDSGADCEQQKRCQQRDARSRMTGHLQGRPP